MDVSERNELYIQVKINNNRHCLPPNYVFKKKGEKKQEEDSDENETLEQEIDNKIQSLVIKSGTPVTLER